MTLRESFKKADRFLGESGYSLISGTTCVFSAFMLVANRPAIGVALAATAAVAAYRGDKHRNSPKP